MDSACSKFVLLLNLILSLFLFNCSFYYHHSWLDALSQTNKVSCTTFGRYQSSNNIIKISMMKAHKLRSWFPSDPVCMVPALFVRVEAYLWLTIILHQTGARLWYVTCMWKLSECLVLHIGCMCGNDWRKYYDDGMQIRNVYIYTRIQYIIRVSYSRVILHMDSSPNIARQNTQK